MKGMMQALSFSTILAFSGLAVSTGPVWAQSADTVRIMQLEEQVRVLNGQVEELRFQMLEMQEQIRKQQEDNEFRIQELEERVDAKEGKGEQRLGKSQPSDTTGETEESGGARPTITDLIDGSGTKETKRRVIDGVEVFDPERDVNVDSLGKSVGSLGAIVMDSNGNIIQQDTNQKPIPLVPQQNQGNGENTSINAGQISESADEMFELGYQYVQAAEYERSAEVFQRFVETYPDDTRISDAQFWLGESLFSQGRYDDAARVFLENHKQHPKARLGAQNLLKLGVSLAGLNQRELACATYAEVPKKYPDLSNSIRNRVEVEQRAAKCKG